MKPNLEHHGDMTLNLDYWDCECEFGYIHAIDVDYCPICGAHREDQPNSRAEEVEHLMKRG